MYSGSPFQENAARAFSFREEGEKRKKEGGGKPFRAPPLFLPPSLCGAGGHFHLLSRGHFTWGRRPLAEREEDFPSSEAVSSPPLSAAAAAAIAAAAAAGGGQDAEKAGGKPPRGGCGDRVGERARRRIGGEIRIIVRTSLLLEMERGRQTDSGRGRQ